MNEMLPLVQRIKRTLIRWTILGILLGSAGFALYCWGAVHYVYARGERAGYIQKFSKKGWLIKTWEGELALMSLPGSMPEIFPFTVRREEVAQELMGHMGQRVTLSYNQHRGLPGRLFGDTSYFVTRVQTVNDVPLAAPSSSSSAI